MSVTKWEASEALPPFPKKKIVRSSVRAPEERRLERGSGLADVLLDVRVERGQFGHRA
jgi:hypothetical protein